jgi:hypothetical protein
MSVLFRQLGRKSRAFIAASSEGKPVAEAVRLNLDGEVESAVWSQGLFGLSASPIESLERISREFDFAILVVTPDDVAEARAERSSMPRDSILFEAGFFVGRLGRPRTFLVCPRDSEIRLPPALAGIASARYSAARAGDLRGALGPACTQIKNTIALVGPSPHTRARESVPQTLPGAWVARRRRQRSLGSARARPEGEIMQIANISVTGALLESSGEVPVGTTLELDLQLDNDARIRATSRVVRIQSPEWGRTSGIGVEFTSLDAASRLALEEFTEPGQAESVRR